VLEPTPPPNVRKRLVEGPALAGFQRGLALPLALLQATAALAALIIIMECGLFHFHPCLHGTVWTTLLE